MCRLRCLKGVTYSAALPARVCVAAQAVELVQHLVADMAAEDIEGRTLTLKLKTSAFEVRQRSRTLARHSSREEELLAAALGLLRAELPVELRLMGVRMGGLRKVRVRVCVCVPFDQARLVGALSVRASPAMRGVKNAAMVIVRHGMSPAAQGMGAATATHGSGTRCAG